MSLIALVLAAFSGAQAGELAGVTLPDQATVGGKTVLLNGIGLREKFYIDVYVAGLYLPTKTGDAAKAVDMDEPKRMIMHFIYSDVPVDKVRETFTSGFAGVPNSAALKERVDKLNSWMVDLTTGDEVVMDYVPGTGTKITVKGQAKGTIEGADFMRGLWSVYLGATPPTAKLKAGLLGQ